jgi:hypothetical protein
MVRRKKGENLTNQLAIDVARHLFIIHETEKHQ